MPMVLISRFTGETLESQSTGQWMMQMQIRDTEIEVMISDLIDSDGMGWTDNDGDAETDDPIVTSITFGSQDGIAAGFVYY